MNRNNVFSSLNLEEELRQSTSLQQAVLNSAPYAIISTNQAGVIQTFNSAAEKLLGYSAADTIGKLSPLRFHDPKEVQLRAKELSEEYGETVPSGMDVFTIRALHGVVDEREWTYIRRDGVRVPVLLSITAMRDASGELTGYLGIATDVSERKRVERTLRLQSTALEAAANAIILTNRKGQILWVNRSFSRLTGYSKKEVLGKSTKLLKSGSHPPEFYSGLWSTILAGRVWHGEMLNRRKDGTCYPEEMMITPVHGESGGIENFIAIKQDITERKKAEKATQIAIEEAQSASRLKGEFLANMSHEIRTPMNGILGMAELLLETQLDGTQKEYTLTLRECADSLLCLLNDILDFSKIEAGKMELESVPFSLRQVMESAAEIFAYRIAAKGIELLCDVDPEIPPRVLGDPGRLRQILVNLLGNAVKFTERGEIGLRAQVLRQGNSKVEISFSVRDTGIGVAKEKQGLIFEKFAQADGSTARKYGGTGLGLAISTQLIGLMGGKLELESELSKGSTFSFMLTIPTANTEFQPAKNRQRVQGLRVLVVDDNSTNRSILARTLASFGCHSGEATDAISTMKMLQEAAATGAPFDVGLIDAQMPVISGMDLGRMIQADPDLKSLRMLMLTSMGIGDNQEQLRKIGFTHCLTKPVRQMQLLESIVASLEGTDRRAGTASMDVLHEASQPNSAACSRKRLLLAEDNPVNRKILTTMLERKGYEVISASDGLQAVLKAKTDLFDLIFMDVQMPEIDGFQATAKIRANETTGHKNVIVALTAHAMKGDRERCLAAGMDDYLTKPIHLKSLLAVLEKWLPKDENISNREDPDAKVGCSQTLDPRVLDEVTSGDADFLAELLEGFERDVNQHFPELCQAISEHDSSKIISIAHRLKGSSSTLGLIKLAALLEKLEHHGNSGLTIDATSLMKSIEAEWKLAQHALHEYENRSKSNVMSRDIQTKGMETNGIEYASHRPGK